MQLSEATTDRPVHWAPTRFVPHAPHSGLNLANWRAKRAGRELRVSAPVARDKLDPDVRAMAAEKGCDCEMFWAMHPSGAQSCDLDAPITYVCQAQIESD